MRRSFLFGIVCFVLGCGPGSPTLSNRVHPVGPAQLVSLYRRNLNDRTFTGYLIQCQLDAGSYKVNGNRIECLQMSDDLRACIVFECSATPPDDVRLIVTGRCRGAVRDGVQRTATVDFCVQVDDCSVMVAEP